jgi:hypothetical protein
MDVVCINQSDLGERAQQVRVMDRIFSSATLAWAGNTAPYVDNVFEFLERLRFVTQQDIFRQNITKMDNLDDPALLHEWLKLKQNVDLDPSDFLEADDPHWLDFYFGLNPGLMKAPGEDIAIDNRITDQHIRKEMNFNLRMALAKLCSREYFERC